MFIMGNDSGVIQNDRIFEMCGEWYFNTREGIEGPYQNHLQAMHKLHVYLGIFGNLDLADRSAPIRSSVTRSNHSLLPAHMQWR